MKSCKKCKRIIIEDFPSWLKNNPQSAYLQCPYCNTLEEIGVIQTKLNGKKSKGGNK